MTDRMLATQAIQLETKAIDASRVILSSLISILEDANKKTSERDVLKSFDRYLAEGGKLWCCPMSKDRIDEFQTEAQKLGLTYAAYEENDNSDVWTVIYKASEKATMNKVLEELTKNGVGLIEDMRMEVNDLIDNLGENQLDETSNVSDTELQMFMVEANKYKIPYALRMSEDGKTIIMTSSENREKLDSVKVGFPESEMKTNCVTDLQSLTKIIEEAKAEKNEDNTKKVHEREYERSK